MKRPARKALAVPEGGWPWDQPAYSFSIGWPTGYEVPGVSPFGAFQPRPATDVAALFHSQAMRAGALVDIDLGRGTLPDLRARSLEAISHNERLRRGTI